VHEISATAVAARDLNTPVALNEPAYVVRVALDTQSIQAYGTQHALNAGMQVQADIVIDRPRLLDWVLEPLRALRGH
jgi:membrane fusion protein